ncbi:hypothetical protein [Demequina sp. NBRC 110054]|uniref:hypothetical protein n=1 Tax=Demequina sp. NBRC 110054 TaxID=1570343 RepID=UPI000A06D7FF|nr:hypothetical protein [Demequina sp. NBRC 110054]
MSGLKGMFEEEFERASGDFVGLAEFDELGAVRSVRRRRATRSMTVAAAGVVGVGVLSVGLFSFAGGDGDPASTPSVTPSATSSSSVSPSPSAEPSVSASPSAVAEAAAAAANEPGPGWFLLDVQVEEDTLVDGSDTWVQADRSTDTLLLVSPGGETTEVLDVADYSASWPVAWFGGEVALLRQELSADSFGWSGTLLTVDLDSGDVLQTLEQEPDSEYDFYYQPWFGALDGGSRIVTLEYLGGLTGSVAVGAVDGASTPLCDTAAVQNDQALSPSGDRFVCFDLDEDREAAGESDSLPATVVVVAPTDGSASEEVTRLSRFAGRYEPSGWMSETELLFARENDAGAYVYFVLDTDSGEVRDAEVPLEASEQLAIFDYDTGTYARGEGADVVFYDESGVRIASATCEGGYLDAEYLTEFSGGRAMVLCGGSSPNGGYGEGSRAAVWLADLVDGGATEIDLSAYPDGDYRTRALPYWGE